MIPPNRSRSFALFAVLALACACSSPAPEAAAAPPEVHDSDAHDVKVGADADCNDPTLTVSQVGVCLQRHAGAPALDIQATVDGTGFPVAVGVSTAVQ